MNRMIVAALGTALLAGCGNSPPAQQAGTDCAAPAPETVTVTAALRNGRADPAPHRTRVALMSKVLVRVEADTEAEVHVHGYDLETEAGPGSPGCVGFVADRSGLFDVEAHPEILLVQLEVR